MLDVYVGFTLFSEKFVYFFDEQMTLNLDCFSSEDPKLCKGVE